MVKFHHKLLKTEKYQIYDDFYFLIFFNWVGDEGKREKTNGMPKKDKGQGV
jgi:hypothetical protein